MLVLGIMPRSQRIVLKKNGMTLATLQFFKDEQGRVKRIGIDADIDIRISREPIPKEIKEDDTRT